MSGIWFVTGYFAGRIELNIASKTLAVWRVVVVKVNRCAEPSTDFKVNVAL